jgi:glyoxylase-like metal-dependent hydrolase (beta-lactamase superfamily II)
LAYHGPNHSPGNIFTYLPAQRILMLVDVVFPGWVPFAYLAESQNIPGWLEAPAQALGYPGLHPRVVCTATMRVAAASSKLR